MRPRARGYRIGLPPFQIDLLTEMGVTYEDAAADTVRGHLGPAEIRCIGLDAMIPRAEDAACARSTSGIASRDRAEIFTQMGIDSVQASSRA
jgi:hypothetical protein